MLNTACKRQNTDAQLRITFDFDAVLACGILAHGLLRLRCNGCMEEKLVASSCKRCGICPSCDTRRMHEATADLVDNVFHWAPERQWVLSFPIPLRSLVAVHPERLAPVLQIIHRAIATFLSQQTGIKRDQASAGAVTLIQRFGSAANLNIHLLAPRCRCRRTRSGWGAPDRYRRRWCCGEQTSGA